MPLDPQARALLDQMAALGGPPLDQQSVAEARAAIAELAEASGEPEAVARVEDRTIPGPLGEIPIRVYAPDAPAPLPTLVYFHGGGWVIGTLDTHDGVCRQLANAARCLVVSVDYRLAPEHPFPAPAEDAYASVCWVAANAATLGGDPARVAVGGDSAGGNLSAVVSLMARDRGGPRLVHQLLVYPVVDAPTAELWPSYRENADGYFLTVAMMQWFWGHYRAAQGDAYACPLHAADFRNLPPALVITAEFDPLRDEGEAYAARLREAGVPVTLTRYDGMIHGFFGMSGVIDRARDAVAEAAAALRTAFAR